ncbi:glycosyltransferase family 4 protein [Phenylobacterium sp.]|jgi:glycosyltransferase involved in cell wall biosynthesis|uniref:glycosyltransferase family 4 protein n=1 Tax=Phenylobacterium sp. TaxID=1871053 RepID=UPI002F93EC0F
MKVLVVNNAAPFIKGGAEFLAEALTARLNATPGVAAELMRLPFRWEPSERLIEEILIHRGLRLTNVDRVIALKFPAYLVPHHNKVLWLLHQFRQAYDLADAGQGLGDTPDQRRIKTAIRRADDSCFRECRAIYVNSPVTQERLRRYNGFGSEVLYPPLNDEALFYPETDDGYIFAGGRVAPGKRQHLLVEAMAQTPPDVRLVIAGPPETEAYADHLRRQVAALDLAGRVELRLGLRPREEIAELTRRARACAYLPFDEDSLGYVTMEAFACGKPVLTTEDSGGLLEIVSEATGAIAPPTAEGLAAGLASLASPGAARERGAAAKAEWERRELSWSKVLARLLA